MKKIITILFFFTQVCFATNHYVKNAGNDGNTGLSDAQAWQTVTKVNTLTPSGDDTIFFNRGDIFRGVRLDAKASGTSGHQIIYAAYGSGNKPIITGANLVTGFSNGGSNIWDVSVTTHPYVVIINRAWGNLKANRAACTVAGDYYWVSNVLSVYATSDPSSKVEAGYIDRTMDTQSKNYLTFINISFEGGNNSGSYEVYTGQNAAVANIKFYNCFFQFSAGGGCRTGGSTSNTGSLFDSCRFYCNYWDGIFGQYDNANITVHNCYFEKNGLVTTTEKNGIYAPLGGWVISNCEFYDNGRYGPTNNPLSHGIYGSASTGTGTITQCISHGHNYGSGFRFRTSVTLDRCISYDNMQAGYSFATHQTQNSVYILTNSIAYNNTTYEIFKGYASSDAGTVTLTLYNNSVYHSANESYTDACVMIAGQVTVFNMKNNNIYSVNKQVFYAAYAPGSSTIDYNCWYRSDANTSRWYWVSTTKTTLAAWQALGFDTHGYYADPKYTDIVAPGYDFNLQAGSPSISTGIGVGLNLDYAGNVWYSTPSIGAYENASAPPTPPGLPEISTKTVTSDNAISALVGGIVTSNGGGTLTVMGVCWSITVNPTISDTKTSVTASLGSFDHIMTGLHGNILYHYRAYATNESGTAYGTDVSFTTPVFSYIKMNGKRIKYKSKIVIIK
jgi:hypothetical protein